MVIHECGWYSKTLLGEFQRVSRFIFGVQHISLPLLKLRNLRLFNSPIATKYLLLKAHSPQLEDHLVRQFYSHVTCLFNTVFVSLEASTW